jgi:hypothetical protein
VTRPGQVNDLRLCAPCALAALPAAIADALVRKGTPEAGARLVRGGVEALVKGALSRG